MMSKYLVEALLPLENVHPLDSGSPVRILAVSVKHLEEPVIRRKFIFLITINIYCVMYNTAFFFF